MRAAEVLNRYATGERDFQNLSLKGKDFSHQDLTDIDFSHADLSGANFTKTNLEGSCFSYANLRGVNFSHAKLQGANLSHVQCGLRKRWLLIFWMASLLVSAYCGWSADIFSTNIVQGAIILNPTATFWPLFNATLALIVLVLIYLPNRYLWKNTFVFFILFTLSPGVLLFLNIRDLFAPLAGTFLVATWLYTIRIELNRNKYRAVALFTIFIVILAWVFIYHLKIIQTPQSWLTFSFLPLLFGFIANSKKLKKVSETVLRNISFIFSMNPGVGTNFRDTDLTGVNISKANLTHSDLLGSAMEGICWFDVQSLEYTRSDSPLLKDEALRELVTSGDGQAKNFAGKNLEGAYLEQANLTNASFDGANLK